ncbi:MAG: hypothetical protein E6I37_06160 [Chloroflexi bacterium]|nr:MAG: hypothetical protein E6I37_06160 [Chloroflexota bacterium]
MPASASQADDYTNAIHRALTLVQFAERGDTPSIGQALQVLATAPGPSQPEILHDLGADPPNLTDADQRLQALYAALQARVDTPDPDRAQQQLNNVLSMPRYVGLVSGPSIIDRIVNTVSTALGRFFRWLGLGNLHLGIPLGVWLALAALFILGIIIWPIRGTLGRGGREAVPRPAPSVVRPSVDFFAEADRLAAAGDFLAAIQALTGGVTVRIGGERAWDRSPFTVRELFARTEHLELLRPLLRSFEEASYGHRAPDRPMYAQAVEAAQRYRQSAA